MNLALVKNKKRYLIFILLFTFLIALVMILNPLFKGGSYNSTLKKAISKKDPLLCEKMTWHVTYGDYDITKEDSILLCKAQYAILTEDLDYCMTLKETPDTYEIQPGIFRNKGIATRDICLKGLAHQLKRPDLCEMLNTAKDSNYGNVYVETCKKQALDPNFNPVQKTDSIPDLF